MEALAAEVHDLVKGLPMVAVHARQVGPGGSGHRLPPAYACAVAMVLSCFLCCQLPQVVATSLRRLSEERLCEVVCDAAGLRRGAAGVPAWPPCTPSLVKRVVQHLVDNMEGRRGSGC